MSQTKKQSLIESFTNVAIGYFVSLISLFIIFPILGIQSSTGKNLIITLYFTAISIARSYILRRYFNNKKPNNKIHKGCICATGVTGFCMEHKTDWV